MRTSLLNPLLESRHARRHRRRASREHEAVAAVGGEVESVAGRTGGDADAQRVREAGGPLDRASYSCSCGCVFDAAVSTSVGCPHCGAEQVW
ncbi:MAG TPA: hypothetical protein VKV16_11555 [Solirubrobacteraceae bacterium]|nr:hypothetical protein [Solirubrobacteraceae bacterium]